MSFRNLSVIYSFWKLIIFFNFFSRQETVFNKRKRSNDGLLNLNADLVIVTDNSVFLAHQRYINSTNTTLVLLHMKAYYAHLIYAVRLTYTRIKTLNPGRNLIWDPLGFRGDSAMRNDEDRPLSHCDLFEISVVSYFLWIFEEFTQIRHR